MRYSQATTAAILAAIGIGEVVAGPTHHLHQRLHEKNLNVEQAEKRADMVVATIDGVVVSWTNNYFGPSATAASTVESTTAPAAADATSTSVATTTSSSGLGVVALWEDLIGYSNYLTEFGAASATSGTSGIDYAGNCGDPYGSNIIKVDSAEGYDFTATFKNTSPDDMTLVIWNKVGPNGEANEGAFVAPVTPTLTFALAPGTQQVVAFADNSQGAWCQATSAISVDGAFDISWGEFNLGSNGSGFDLSAIPNSAGNTYNMTISSAENSCVSNNYENYWLTATDPVGSSDGSCYIPDSTATLTVLMGGPIS